jgi:hypothetical protein
MTGKDLLDADARADLALSGSALNLQPAERDPVRLHDGALKGLIPATAWREAS